MSMLSKAVKKVAAPVQQVVKAAAKIAVAPLIPTASLVAPSLVKNNYGDKVQKVGAVVGATTLAVSGGAALGLAKAGGLAVIGGSSFLRKMKGKTEEVQSEVQDAQGIVEASGIPVSDVTSDITKNIFGSSQDTIKNAPVTRSATGTGQVQRSQGNNPPINFAGATASKGFLETFFDAIASFFNHLLGVPDANANS